MHLNYCVMCNVNISTSAMQPHISAITLGKRTPTKLHQCRIAYHHTTRTMSLIRNMYIYTRLFTKLFIFISNLWHGICLVVENFDKFFICTSPKYMEGSLVHDGACYCMIDQIHVF